MRFGISETSWMLPKILRIRLDAVDRRSVAGFALVAMWCCRLFSPSPQRRLGSMLILRCLSRDRFAGASRRKKPRFPRVGIHSFSVYETSADQCVERAARRRVLFRKAVVMAAI